MRRFAVATFLAAVSLVSTDIAWADPPAGMVAVPGGTFQMGDPWSEGGSEERPVHAVYISPFYIDTYEVTNQQYADALNWAYAQGGLIQVTGNVVYKYGGTTYPYCDTTLSSPYSRITWSGSTFGVVSGKENHPMVMVSWYGGAAYCNWRSAIQGRPLCYDLSTWACNFGVNGYRLPTEAEWEKAGGWDPVQQRHYRFGEQTDGCGTNCLDGQRANYESSGDPFEPGADPDTTPVGYYDGTTHGSYTTQNAQSYYGCYDISGNVWEWCYDWYSSTYYSTSPSSDPTGPSPSTYRVHRGACWNGNPLDCRSATRGTDTPAFRWFNIGFRCALTWWPPIESAMVTVTAGEYQMGDHHDGEADALPFHMVYINAFDMDTYEVTNQQYATGLNWAYAQGNLITVTAGVVYKYGGGTVYCDTTTSSSYSRIAWDGSRFGVVAGKENHPMVMVSWYGSLACANWRSAMEGRPLCYDLSTWDCDFSTNGYRLLTEAEWEKGARGGHYSPYWRYPWGDSIVTTIANYLSSGDPYEAGANPWTTPVGFYTGELHYKADYGWPGSQTSYQTSNGMNGWGLYDMAGDVWEWCNDWYGSTYYGSSPSDNPHGPTSGSYRVLRGGSWSGNSTYLRCAHRDCTPPDYRINDYGFRLASVPLCDINCEDLTGFDFGSLLGGACSSEHTWTVINEGGGTLTGTITLTGTNADEFELTQGDGDFSLAAGASLTVGVQFCPQTLGSKTATLHITSNDPDENPCDKALSGTGTGPDINCEDLADYDWGTIPGECSDVHSWIITNEGNATLNGEVSLTGADADLFEFTEGGGTFALDPAANRTVGVRLCCDAPGVKNATLHITSNDPDENPCDKPISGTCRVFVIGGAIFTDCNPFNGVGGVAVTVIGTNGTFNAVTSANFGIWQIDDIPPGTYTVTPSLSGWNFCYISTVCPPSGCDGSTQITVDAPHEAANQSIRFLAQAGTTPEINCEDLSGYDFGTIVPGNCSAEHTWLVTNEGTATLSGAISITGADQADFGFTVGDGIFDLAPSHSLLVGVRFCPDTSGSKTAKLHIVSNDADENPCEKDLAGTGSVLQPDINCEDLSGYDFGTVTPGGCSAEHAWIVTNEGAAALSGTISVTGTNPDEFPFTQGGGALSLGPSASKTVGVRFCPQTSGPKSATLHIVSNDPDENPCDESLDGIGGPGSAHASRDLSQSWPSYCAGDDKLVYIDITMPPGAYALGIEDQPPSGWTVSGISHSGHWDAVNHKVKWGPFFAPNFPTEVSYTVTVPPSASGTYCFAGSISIDGQNETIVGDDCLDGPSGQYSPADESQPSCPGCGGCSCATCEDHRVTMCEMIGYACAWKRGCNDDLAGMGGAAYVWISGECYCWDTGEEQWSPSACPPDPIGCCTGRGDGLARLVAGDAARELPAFVPPNSWFGVAITITPPPGVMVVALEDQPPAGWLVRNISDGGAWDEIHGKVKWGPFFDPNVPAGVTYELLPPPGATGEYCFAGTVSFNGQNRPISGDGCVRVGAFGDFDFDGDLDLFDFASFELCFGESPVSDECAMFDFDSSDMIDLADYADFAQALTGPNE